jgi:hypothetical protein
MVPRRTARLRATQTSLESLLRRAAGGPQALVEPARRRQGAARAIHRTPSAGRLQTVPAYPQVNKSGLADRAKEAPNARRQRARRHGYHVAGDPDRLWLGASGRTSPGERGRGAGRRGPTTAGASARRDADRPGDRRDAPAGRGALPQGQRQLLAGPLPLLRHPGAAPDQQHPGALLRLRPLPPPSRQRTHPCLGRHRGSRLSPRPRLRRRTSPPVRRVRTAPSQRHPNLDRWRTLRQSLELRQEARRRQGRFRKNPTAYLAALEARLLKPSLPS